MKQCERDGCEVTFEPQRSTARFCSARCRVAAGRAEVKAAAALSVPWEHVIQPGEVRAGNKIMFTASGEIPAASRTVSEACTCLIGHFGEHKGGECTCTTSVMNCAVHAGTPAGQAERAATAAQQDSPSLAAAAGTLTAVPAVLYPCCKHCSPHPHAAHADPCRQGCPA